MATFTTNPVNLEDLLKKSHTGKLQLPDFQRSWVWDEDRIKSLIASISRAFPVGALMALETGGGVNFRPRLVEGAPTSSAAVSPEILLLDGQQRITSMYQVTLRGSVVETLTPRNKKVRRWFYIDIQKALDPGTDREDAIITVPEGKKDRPASSRDVLIDVSSITQEYKELMFPMTDVFDWDSWQDGFHEYWKGDANEATRKLFKKFKDEVLQNFSHYQVPVITLEKTTSKEAVCVVFEKVNTGGKALDAFELVTAMYAAEQYELRKDWYGDEKNTGRHGRFKELMRIPGSQEGILAQVASTDVLQAISLFHTRQLRADALKAGKTGTDLPAITGNRQALLSLPLSAYVLYQDRVEKGFILAAKFLFRLRIFRTFDLPYQSQVVPLAAILADLGDKWEHAANYEKLVRWYWCGVFGELYGSSVETRNAKDFVEVLAWLKGGEEPATIRDAQFHSDRLKTMRMRLSAAYKGVNALLMQRAAKDFRSGQEFDHTVFFGEAVDIHHIFPQDWCKAAGIDKDVYDSIINKTPLSARSNRIIGGVAPSAYLSRLANGDIETPPIPISVLDSHLSSHFADPALMWSDGFHQFMVDRQGKLLALILDAMGKSESPKDSEDGDANERETDELEAGLTL